MKRNKIGILTFWNVPNYGCFLQAYALQKYISDLFPDKEVAQLAYLEKNHYRQYYGFFDKKFPHTFINYRFYRHILGQIKNRKSRKRIKKFVDYYDEIPSFRYTGGKLNDSICDMVVFGSDIIWDFSSEIVLNEKELFGNLIEVRKIAYAPSVGNAIGRTNIPGFVYDGIRSFESVAVRDSNSQKVVEAILGRSVQIVLDPTLLYDFRSDTKVKKPLEEKKYILIYGIHFDDNFVDEIVSYATEKDLCLINLSFYNNDYEWCNKNIKIGEMTPFEWVGYIKFSEVIITSTYHGLLFGLCFNKKIIFKATEFILNKLGDLPNILGIKDLIVSNASLSERISYKWNYDIINSKLSQLRIESRKYLLDCLSA